MDIVKTKLIIFLFLPVTVLDGKHTVFGKVVDGLLTLRKIENVPTKENNRPRMAVRITGEHSE